MRSSHVKIDVTVISKIPFASTSVNGSFCPLEQYLKKKAWAFRNSIHKRKNLSGVENTKALKLYLRVTKLQCLFKPCLLPKSGFTQSSRRKLQQNLSCELQAENACIGSLEHMNKTKQINRFKKWTIKFQKKKKMLLSQQQQLRQIHGTCLEGSIFLSFLGEVIKILFFKL